MDQAVTNIFRFLSPGLTGAAERAVLASWASDAHAVADAPGLRRLDNGAVVEVRDILRALQALDGPEAAHGHGADAEAGEAQGGPAGSRGRRRRPLRRWISAPAARRRHDDDDDPPPCPAVIAPVPRLPPLGATAMLEAA